MARLARTMAEVAQAYGIAKTPSAAELFDASYLPPQAERMLK
jgi:hypothetical protein